MFSVVVHNTRTIIILKIELEKKRLFFIPFRFNVSYCHRKRYIVYIYIEEEQ